MTATTTEFEDYLELEDEASQHEDFFEFEDESQHEDFLGGLLSSVLGGEVAGPLGEQEELQLAAELLEVGNEQELEQFLGGLLSKAVKGIGNFARSKTGRALGGMLKGLAKKALPVVGGALGSLVAPGVGTAIGSKLGSLAGGLFEYEQEGGHQELEFEMARRVIQISTAAARRAAAEAGHGADPMKAARRALIAATKRHAPGVIAGGRGAARGQAPQRFRDRRPRAGRRGRRHRHGYGGYGYPVYLNGSGAQEPDDSYDADGFPESNGESGQWVRRGRNIVLIGV